MGFCSRLHITPVDMEFHDDNYDGSDSSVSNQSSDIEEESKLKSFTQALQMAQTAALKKEIENKRGPYSKKSERTHRRHKQRRTELASKGFLSVSEYMSLKGSSGPEKHDTLTPELDAIALQEELEESSSSSEANTLDQDNCAYSSVSASAASRRRNPISAYL